MRVRSFALAGLALLAGFMAVEGQAVARIGYINTAVILEETPGAQEANQAWERELGTYRTEVERMAEELQGMMAQYDRQQLTLSPEAKARREEDIRRKQQEYQDLVQRLDQQAQQRQQELVQPVLDRVTAVIEQLREEEGYAIIFDVAAGSIIAADPSLDLTDEVIRRLRAVASSGR